MNKTERQFFCGERVRIQTPPQWREIGISAPFSAPKRPGVNAPCPCGSGKKFKKCCAKTLAENQQKTLAEAREPKKSGMEVTFGAQALGPVSDLKLTFDGPQGVQG